MDPQLLIRRATIADHDVLVANNQAMALETEGLHLDPTVLGPGVMALLTDPGKGYYLVAESGGKVVGNLMITTEWSDWRNCALWWFQSVFVHPDWRGKGVFAALYRHVYASAAAQGVKELRLYVERENVVAQKVYAAMGMDHSHYDMWEVKVSAPA